MLVVELDLIDNPGILMKMLIYFLQAVLWMAVKHQDKRAIQVMQKATTTKENTTTEMKVMLSFRISSRCGPRRSPPQEQEEPRVGWN